MAVTAVLIAAAMLLGQINAAFGTTSGIQYNLPTCRNTVQLGGACGSSNPIRGTCCPIGLSCEQAQGKHTHTCVESTQLSWDFAPPACTTKLHPNVKCGAPAGAPAPCVGAVCLLMLPSTTCCPDGYICSGSSTGELGFSSTGSYTCQPSMFPVVPPQLDNPVLNASMLLQPLPAVLTSLLGPSRGLKFARSPPRTSSIFATPQVAALGAVAALPAALPAVIAGGVEARGADINARVLPDGTIAPAPGPGHRHLLGPDPFALYTFTPAPAPFLSQPPAPVPGPFSSPPRKAGPPAVNPSPTPDPVQAPAPAPVPSSAPELAPVPAPMMPPSPAPGPVPSSAPVPASPPASVTATPGAPPTPASDSGTLGTPPPPASVTGTSGAPPPPALITGTPDAPPPPAAVTGIPGAPPPPGTVTADSPPPPADVTGTPGTPPPPAGVMADAPPPPDAGMAGTPPPPAGVMADTPPPPAGVMADTPPPPAGVAGTPPPPDAGTPGTPPPPAAGGGPLPPVKLVDDTFVNANTGDVIELHGMSWFGFNNGQTMVDGLYAGNTYQIADFKTIVFRQQQLGFNAVRLPFTFSDLNLAPKSWTMACTDDTASLKADLEDPDAPYNGINYSSKKFPAFTPLGNGVCNSDLPNDSTLNRYLFVIEYYVSQGFYVLVDYHAYPGDTTVASGALVSDWQTLWKAITALPSFASDLAGRVFLDLINEPDGINIRWEAANGNPALADLYINTMTALDAIDKRAIYFIEGAGQSGFVTAWGDGFVTNDAIISQNGLSDPKPFFDRLSTMPFLDRVVLSPHMYGDSVTGGSASLKEGADLYNRLSQSTGVLAKFGYTPSGGGTAHRFPIAIGEFGTKFTSSDDMAWIHDFSQWRNNIGAANDGLHDNVNSYFYWCWNANSGDTGGLVDDSWLTIQWPKVNFLTVSPNAETADNAAAPGGWGLTPWYLS